MIEISSRWRVRDYCGAERTLMETQFNLGDIKVDVHLKNIRNINLRVYPPVGRVRISAPRRMHLDSIRAFAVSKLDWIRKQQNKVQKQRREPPREYIDGERHFVWGRQYRMNVEERHGVPGVSLGDDSITLRVRPGASAAKRADVLNEWYRKQITEKLPEVISRWEEVLGVKIEAFTVRKMKTLWGSCSPRRRTVRFNLELARKAPACLEYIVLHELVHLLEPTHNNRFKVLISKFMPEWRLYRNELNMKKS